MTAKRIEVALGEPEIAAMQGTEAFLTTANADQAGIQIVGKAMTGEDTLGILHELRPDVTLMAIHFPDVSGFEILEKVKEDGLSIIIYTRELAPEAVVTAIKLGAKGFIGKYDQDVNLIDAVQTVAQGHPVICRGGLQVLFDRIRELPVASLSAARQEVGLTGREREVLQLLSNNHSVYAVAQTLGISPHTVNTHTKHAHKKLGVSSRAAAVRKAMALGLLT